MRRLLAGLVLLLAAVAGALPVQAAQVQAPPTVTPARAILGHDGRWITDDQGRVVIMHGFNMVAKAAPHDPSQLGFGEKDARFLAAHGFNVVRLGIVLAALEPEPGEFDDRYLANIERTIDVLGRYGIHTLVDIHQDLLSPKFKGFGLPDWMIKTDGIPTDLLNTDSFKNLMFNPALQRANDNFWNNGVVHGRGLQEWYTEAWIHIAKALKGNPAVLGYDLWNEPWPGTAWPGCVPPFGCKDFESKKLAPFFTKMIKGIRTVDREHLTWYEPTLLAPFGAPTHLGRPGDAKSGYSFHAYCPDLSGRTLSDRFYAVCDEVQKIVFDQALKQQERTGDAVMLTEFGATPNGREIEYVIRLADSRRMPWIEWTYCRCKDPTDGGTVDGLVLDLTKPRSGANVNAARLKIMDEPYPQTVAGVPESYGFDPATRTFRFTFTPEGTAETLVHASPLQYPGGYTAQVTGAKITSAPDAARLVLRANRGAKAVTLTLTPR
ncbi:cellulase family glycosylhydrolase [Actinocorallia longicatena]|uniref:Endoglycosylceramidase n=1 Tax=Actinocorallia longicatena TaxID=111803 RepID=A0ABP6Q7T6_9ACTN